VFVLLFSSSVLAAKQEKKKKAEVSVAQQQQTAVPEQLSPEQAARQELFANINAIQNAQIRVAVLQQLLNEESAKLMNIQAVFCDRYKLDVDKFRKGLYIYDDRIGKFVEQEPQQQQ
jgi:hypothetical protein